MIAALLRSFDLRRDQREPEAIHDAISGGVRSAGTNLWVLIFAIFMASIGLNVNSTAVIIGAMLISPLMGPIVAVGYGAGVNDFALIKRGLRTLWLFLVISLITATLYFAVSPLSQAQSELLARTTPTLWDVAIAFFGGAAGIVAVTRRHFSNIVPGVAIATALMPPLCTAGYGLATRNLPYFGGAIYLFSINAVFIAVATLLITKVLRLPPRAAVNPVVRQRTRLIIGTAVTITLVPSIYLAWRLVQQEFFSSAVARVVRELADDQRFVVLGSDVNARERTVVITLGGESPPPDLADRLASQLHSPTAGTASVRVRYAGVNGLNLQTLRQELQRDLARTTTQQTESQQRLLNQLQLENAALRGDLSSRDLLLAELRAEFPEARTIAVAHGVQQAAIDSVARRVLLVQLELPRAVGRAEGDKLRARLAVRFPDERIELITSRAN